MRGFKARWAAVLALLILLGAGAQGTVPVGEAFVKLQTRTFPETGKTVQGKFLSYWNANGGLARFGYPISEPIEEPYYVRLLYMGLPDHVYTETHYLIAQYFERVKLEYYPRRSPSYNDIEMPLLGVFQYQEKYAGAGPVQVPNTEAGSVLSEETGKRIGGKFLQYWQAHGDVPVLGLPISDEFQETSSVDGRQYKVQYFERAVMEYHPENAPPYDILLSLLGPSSYTQRYATQEPVPAGPNAIPLDTQLFADYLAGKYKQLGACNLNFVRVDAYEELVGGSNPIHVSSINLVVDKATASCITGRVSYEQAKSWIDSITAEEREYLFAGYVSLSYETYAKAKEPCESCDYPCHYISEEYTEGKGYLEVFTYIRNTGWDTAPTICHVKQ